MDTDILREVIMLAEKNNYAKAAEQLYISQSALSRHIVALEAKLNVQLFERNPRQVKLTRYGEALMPFAKSMIDLEDEGLKALETVRLSDQKAIRIGSIHGLSGFGIMKKITGFISENPDLSLRLFYSDSVSLREMLSKDEADVIIVMSGDEYEDDEKTRSLKLAEDRLVVVLPKDHPLKDREKISISDISEEELILQEDNSSLGGIIRDMIRKSRVTVSPSRLHVAGVGAIEMAEQGLGVAIEQQKVVERHQSYGLTYIPLVPEKKIWIRLIWRKNISYAGALFSEYMKKNRNKQ